MIRLFRITIPHFIQSYLPPHKRMPQRILFYKIMAYPFTLMMEAFIAWRDSSVTKANVSNETISLEWYLNSLFDTDEQRIEIISQEDAGLLMGRRDTEATFYQPMGRRDTEATFYKAMPIRGEDLITGLFSFIVSIPEDIEDKTDAIAGIVKMYKYAGFSFKIVTS